MVYLVTRSRSNRSRAGRSSFGKSTCRVIRIALWFPVSALRGFREGSSLLFEEVGFGSEEMSEVMKVRVLGRGVAMLERNGNDSGGQ